MWVDELDENYVGNVIKFRVNEVEVVVHKKLFGELFHLSDRGKKSAGAGFIDLPDGSLGTLYLMYEWRTYLRNSRFSWM